MAVLLIAEDDADVRVLLERVFVRAGFAVLTAPDGAGALDLVRSEPVDVVLTDLDMPRMDGLELCAAVRRDRRVADLPVAVLSGGIQPGDPRVAGAQLCGVLLKPFANKALVAAVRRLADAGPHPHGDGSSCPPLD